MEHCSPIPNAPEIALRKTSSLRRFAQRLACLLLLFLLTSCVAAPRKISVSHDIPVSKIDQRGYNQLLEENVHGGFVNYPAFCGSPEFSRYLEDISRADLSAASRDETISFLINAYNAWTIQAILQGGTPATLLGRYEFFLRTRHPVAGEEITLWDQEHERLRPLGDPRIHFAIVCASSSCPKLESTAFDPETLSARLEIATRNFINDPERNHFYPEEAVAKISSIFEWYEEDFTSSDSTLSDYISRYVNDPSVADGLRNGLYEIRFLPYDWALNGLPPSSMGHCLKSNRNQ